VNNILMIYNPNFPPSRPGQDVSVQKAVSNMPTPEDELNERFLRPYLDSTPEELAATIQKLEADLIAESQKPGNEDNPTIAFSSGLFSQELYLLMKTEQGMHAVNNLPPGKSLETLTDAELEVLTAKYPRKQELIQRLEFAIMTYRTAAEKAWDMRPSEHTKVDQYTAQTMLADLLYRRAAETEDKDKREADIKEADDIYRSIIESQFVEGGQRDELKFICVLRDAHRKYSPDKPFLVEHSTPREDLRDPKSDVKMYTGVYSYLIQLKALTGNEYVREHSERIMERARQHVGKNTFVVKITAASIRDAYAEPGRVNTKHVVQELAQGIEESGGYFSPLYLVPREEVKAREKKRVNRRTVEADVVRYASLPVLRKFGLDVEASPTGISAGKRELTDMLVAALEGGAIAITKEMLMNPSDELVAIVKQYRPDNFFAATG